MQVTISKRLIFKKEIYSCKYLCRIVACVSFQTHHDNVLISDNGFFHSRRLYLHPLKYSCGIIKAGFHDFEKEVAQSITVSNDVKDIIDRYHIIDLKDAQAPGLKVLEKLNSLELREIILSAIKRRDITTVNSSLDIIKFRSELIYIGLEDLIQTSLYTYNNYDIASNILIKYALPISLLLKHQDISIKVCHDLLHRLYTGMQYIPAGFISIYMITRQYHFKDSKTLSALFYELLCNHSGMIIATDILKLTFIFRRSDISFILSPDIPKPIKIPPVAETYKYIKDEKIMKRLMSASIDALTDHNWFILPLNTLIIQIACAWDQEKAASEYIQSLFQILYITDISEASKGSNNGNDNPMELEYPKEDKKQNIGGGGDIIDIGSDDFSYIRCGGSLKHCTVKGLPVGMQCPSKVLEDRDMLRVLSKFTTNIDFVFHQHLRHPSILHYDLLALLVQNKDKILQHHNKPSNGNSFWRNISDDDGTPAVPIPVPATVSTIPAAGRDSDSNSDSGIDVSVQRLTDFLTCYWTLCYRIRVPHTKVLFGNVITGETAEIPDMENPMKDVNFSSMTMAATPTNTNAKTYDSEMKVGWLTSTFKSSIRDDSYDVRDYSYEDGPLKNPYEQSSPSSFKDIKQSLEIGQTPETQLILDKIILDIYVEIYLFCINKFEKELIIKSSSMYERRIFRTIAEEMKLIHTLLDGEYDCLLPDGSDIDRQHPLVIRLLKHEAYHNRVKPDPIPLRDIINQDAIRANYRYFNGRPPFWDEGMSTVLSTADPRLLRMALRQLFQNTARKNPCAEWALLFSESLLESGSPLGHGMLKNMITMGVARHDLYSIVEVLYLAKLEAIRYITLFNNSRSSQFKQLRNEEVSASSQGGYLTRGNVGEEMDDAVRQLHLKLSTPIASMQEVLAGMYSWELVPDPVLSTSLRKINAHTHVHASNSDDVNRNVNEDRGPDIDSDSFDSVNKDRNKNKHKKNSKKITSNDADDTEEDRDFDDAYEEQQEEEPSYVLFTRNNKSSLKSVQSTAITDRIQKIQNILELNNKTTANKEYLRNLCSDIMNPVKSLGTGKAGNNKAKQDMELELVDGLTAKDWGCALNICWKNSQFSFNQNTKQRLFMEMIRMMKDYGMDVQTNNVKQLVEFLVDTDQQHISDSISKIMKKINDDKTYCVSNSEILVFSKLLMRSTINGYIYLKVSNKTKIDFIFTSAIALDKFYGYIIFYKEILGPEFISKFELAWKHIFSLEGRSALFDLMLFSLSEGGYAHSLYRTPWYKFRDMITILVVYSSSLICMHDKRYRDAFELIYICYVFRQKASAEIMEESETLSRRVRRKRKYLNR